MAQEPPRAQGRPHFPGRASFLWVLFVAFVGGGFYSGWLSVPRVLGWVGSIAPLMLTERLLPFEQVAAPNKVAPDWKNLERVNILLLGVDRRPGEEDVPARTDTMIVLTIDPYSRTAGMLSIPRDLLVPIPNKPGKTIHDRINTANFYGDWEEYPGGGPALAKETVQYNFGVRIHYFVMVDFDGFERIIDAVGGVNLDVEAPLVDYQYPTRDYGYKRISIPAGPQTMDGEQALIYARTRHMDSDFGRMKRQQQVIKAVRSRLLQLDALPKLPALWNEFRESVKTDMSLSEILIMAQIANDIAEDGIAGATLDAEYVTPVTTWDGAQLLNPNRAKIGEVVNRIFFDARRVEEGARIEVLNATLVKGLATTTAKLLETHGFGDVSVGDSQTVQTITQVQNFNGKAYTAALIASLLKLPKERVVSTPRPSGAEADIRIILGDDARP